MYYTPILDHLFNYNDFSYRALQGRLKVIRSEFGDAIQVKLNASKTTLCNEFKRICYEWAVLKAEYQGHQDYVNAKYAHGSQQKQVVEPAKSSIYELAKSRKFSHHEALQMQVLWNNSLSSARVRNAINARLA